MRALKCHPNETSKNTIKRKINVYFLLGNLPTKYHLFPRRIVESSQRGSEYIHQLSKIRYECEHNWQWLKELSWVHLITVVRTLTEAMSCFMEENVGFLVTVRICSMTR